MSEKPNAEQASKKLPPKVRDECSQGGYGYMKRRRGLLSFEVDKIKDKVSKPDPKDT